MRSSSSSDDDIDTEPDDEISTPDFDESSSSLTPRSSSSLASSSSSSFVAISPCPNATTGNNTMTCGGKTYKTVDINGQVWMAENLNYNASGSKCGGTDSTIKDENTENCDKYGRLYSWNQAVAACPSGWHLPSNADWNALLKFVDSVKGGDGYESSCATGTCYDSYTAGKYLKATSGWVNNGNGTDDFGFTALPGGNGYPDRYFVSAGDYGLWWSSSEENSDIAYYRFMRNDGRTFAYYGSNLKSYLFSVRCLQD